MLNPIAFLEAKRDGRSHSEEEIRAFVSEAQAGRVADYQVSAWLMAAFLRGLSEEETAALTLALADSGERVSFPPDWPVVDKHSTGGVGDKATLVCVPLAAAGGARVAKLSGRGLGFTGGTVDKLEAIPGFRTHLPLSDFLAQVERIGCAVSGHSPSLAPAEGLFYSLRDVTGTVPSLPLIVSSILSKKLAGGGRGFVFDVKAGNGAFLPEIERTRELARSLVGLSRRLGRPAVALLSDMDQPLGRMVGNGLEVQEAIRVLRGEGPEDVRDLCVALSGEMLRLAGVASDREAGCRIARSALDSGRGLEVFREMVRAQGGDPRVCDDPEGVLPKARYRETIRSPRSGVVARMEARGIGEAVRLLGGGRMRREDPIDPAVGLRDCRKVGEPVSVGEPLMEVLYDDPSAFAAARGLFVEALAVADAAEPRPLLIERIE